MTPPRIETAAGNGASSAAPEPSPSSIFAEFYFSDELPRKNSPSKEAFKNASAFPPSPPASPYGPPPTYSLPPLSATSTVFELSPSPTTTTFPPIAHFRDSVIGTDSCRNSQVKSPSTTISLFPTPPQSPSLAYFPTGARLPPNAMLSSDTADSKVLYNGELETTPIGGDVLPAYSKSKVVAVNADLEALEAAVNKTDAKSRRHKRMLIYGFVAVPVAATVAVIIWAVAQLAVGG